MKRPVVIDDWTCVLGAHGEPLHVQMPVGMARRTSESLLSRSSEWFSCAASRLKNPDDSCFAEFEHAFELL